MTLLRKNSLNAYCWKFPVLVIASIAFGYSYANAMDEQDEQNLAPHYRAMESRFLSVIDDLKKEIAELKAKNNQENHNLGSLSLWNETQDWITFTQDGSWKAINFENSDQEGNNLDYLTIPADGKYKITAFYCVYSPPEQQREFQIGIARDKPDNVIRFKGGKGPYKAHGQLETLQKLKKGDKIMLSLSENLNFMYYASATRLRVEPWF